MAALLGLDLAKAREVAQDAAGDDICEIANDNAPGQVVISGHKPAIDRAVEIARAAGARRAILLPVSAPFHCSLMEPAARAMAEALGKTAMSEPAVPLVANISAKAVRNPGAIREGLVEQVTGTVRWSESVSYLANESVDTLVELGAGKVLTGLARRINRDLKASAIAAPADIEAFLATG